MRYQQQFSTYTFAYYSVYNKQVTLYDSQLNAPPITNTYIKYKDILIDPILNTDWIDKLLQLCNDKIKLIAVSPGYNRNYLTHIIFQLIGIDQIIMENIVIKLNLKPLIKSSYFIDGNSSYLCIATQNWYRLNPNENVKWKKWWSNSYELIKMIFIQQELL